MTFTECIKMGGTMNECNTVTEPSALLLVACTVLAWLVILATLVYKGDKS